MALRRHWVFSAPAGVSNGIYPTDAPAQVEYLCADSRTVYLFVEDDEQLTKALEARPAAGPAQDHRVRHGRAARFPIRR
jgi:long-subunit acyl-CoA synthetase (AMP-forming)